MNPGASGTKRTAVLNVVGLCTRLLGKYTPNLCRLAQSSGGARVIRPAFPAVTCTAQATYLTGAPPADHGIVANGWYDRALAEVHFWKQSNRLVTGKKIWELARERDPAFTCANLFWWFNRYSSVDNSVTPRPIYCADGKKVFDVTGSPPELVSELKDALGDFPFHSFWGPRAGIKSSRWIARAAQWVEQRSKPSLNLIYLPHLDYDLQRIGPDLASPMVQTALHQIDDVVGELSTFFAARGVHTVVLSEYAITPVDRPIYLNRLFRSEGWLGLKDELGREVLDPGSCRVFAVADHQVAHVYINDPNISSDPVQFARVQAMIEAQLGVEQVLDRAAQEALGVWHARSGDFLVVADARSWFAYYYWLDDSKAPDFARTIDIHRKPGYDPCELLMDPTLRAPAWQVGKFLLKKKVGLRALLEVVPLDPALIRGSHGRIPESSDDWPVFIAPGGDESSNTQPLQPAHVFAELLRVVSG